MKKINHLLIIFILLFSFSTFSEEFTGFIFEIDLRDSEIAYKVNSDIPVIGILKEFFINSFE